MNNRRPQHRIPAADYLSIRACLMLLSLSLSWHMTSPVHGQVDNLLNDTKFAEGFGAAFIYGSEYSGGRRPPLGKVLKYRDISPWQVFLIPDGPVKKVGVKTYPWDFQEGLHHNFKDQA